MQYRPLGQSGLQVSAIGLGTEHLLHAPQDIVIEVVHTALDRGVNYFDLIWAHPEYRDNFAAALKGRRDEVILAGHLGSALKGSQYSRTRNPQVAEEFLLDLLTRLGTDYVDVLMVHNVNSIPEYETLLRPEGMFDLARRWKEQGRTRCIAMSGHSVELMSRSIVDGAVDTIMLPVNISGNAQPGRRELLQTCAKQGIGLIAMKPFAGGKLFQRRHTVYFARYQTGGASFKKKVPAEITPVQCLSYVLAQAGVSTAIPGVKTREEMVASLALLEASAEEQDFSAIISDFAEYVSGECVYCNHCLPCPVEIDIGYVCRLVDTADDGISPSLQRAYNTLKVKASACTDCGACVKRCPFEVDAQAKMGQAVALFEATS